ncbi:DUF4349 domain-containing protein [Candidatus Poriferisodalis sp.]|uniref:DUF4349 domain-containing protein n=1 Tax=Candidatus Poriferisodalis sp. TaxID=3101277 RepID=UPI003B5A0B76
MSVTQVALLDERPTQGGDAMGVPSKRTLSRSSGRRARWLAVAAALLLLTSACVGGGDDDSGDADSESFAMATEAASHEDAMFDEEMADEEMAEVQMTQEEGLETGRRAAGGDAAEEDMSDDSGTSALAAGVPAVPADLGRDIIYTAWIAVETADVATAAAQANSIIEGLGGFTFSQDTRTQDRARTTLTFKVRPEQFSTALERLSNVGELVEQSVNAEDVTDTVVDLNSRISTAEISVNRLRDFLSQATDVEGVAELERELANRETNLERLRGQLRSLRDRVDLATITLSITESVEAVPRTSVILRAWMAAGDEDPCLGFTDLAAPPDGDVGFCFELENEGETVLTEVMLSSNELRFNTDDLIVPDGTDLERIEPGERAVATLALPVTDGRIAGRVATRGLEINVRLSAVPVTESGTELARLARSQGLYLFVEEEDTPPSFGDALSGGWNALVAVGNGVLLIIGALLPFLPVILIALAVAWWWLRRRRARQAVAALDADEA